MWIRLTETTTGLASGNSAALILSFNAAALALRPFTIIRTRGIWNVSSDQEAADEDCQVALTGCVVSDQASAIGITAVPTGYTDAGSDLFFLYEQQAIQTRFLSTSGFNIYTGVTYDSKAMRKVNDDQDVIWCLENSGVSDGSTIFHSGRVLIKLH